MPEVSKKEHKYCYDAWLHWSLYTNKCSLDCTYCFAGYEQRILKKDNRKIKNFFKKVRRVSKLELRYFLRTIKDKLANRAGKRMEIDIPALIKTLDKTKKIFRISFTSNGEPFLITNMVEALLEISKKHYVNFCTNLVTGRIREFLEKVNPEKVPPITASLHIKALERKNLLHKYMENFLLARNRGITIINQVVAYPPLQSEVEKYRNFFKKHEMTIAFSPFSGVYNEMTYPDAYTKKELEIFNINNTLHRFSMKGKLCNAGYNAGTVSPAGNIQPCTAFDEYLGNIYYNINFDNRLRKCPVGYCSCPLCIDSDLFKKAIEACQSCAK